MKKTVANKMSGRPINQPVAAPHVVIIARAGTGKTTTLVEGLKFMRGLPTKITPSDQQQAVWEQLALTPATASACFVAFNKSIATELQQRVPPGCQAMTMHSMGLKAVTAAYGRVQVNSYRCQDIIAELMEQDIRDLRRNEPVLVGATEKLVGLCKMNLIGTKARQDGILYDREGNEIEGYWDSMLSELAAYHDIDLNGTAGKVFDLVPRVLERARDVTRDKCIDFNDMVWLPVELGLSMWQYDLLLVDESQDLSRVQQALARKAGRRLVLCGDPAQAIYGFAGADCESIDRMVEELASTPLGVKVLPLTVTRRCGKAIVAEANKIVKDFDAHESNGEGNVIYGAVYHKDNGTVVDTYHAFVNDGDMVLCRVNAPLVSQCFRFLKMGRKANIQGRDIGAGLISLIKKMKTENVTELVRRLDDWYHKEANKEYAKRNPSEAKLIALSDRLDCIACFSEGAETVSDIIGKIEAIFTDDRNGTGVRLSSIHKAKGLEAQRVFLLEPEGSTVPHPMAKSGWQVKQEYNLRYVAITRAISELVFVS